MTEAPSTNPTFINGIDVSNHQASIDLAAVPYAVLGMKVTEGQGWVDPAWPQLLAKHRAKHPTDEMPVLLYHYVSQGNTPLAEAANFLREWAKAKPGPNYIPVLDWEPQGSSPAPNNVSWAVQWLVEVERVTGRLPWVYSNLYTANTHAALWESSGIGAKHPLWLAHYPGSNTAIGYNPVAARGSVDSRWKTLAGWQFTDGGKLPGYGGSLDLNEFYLNPATGKLYGLAAEEEEEPMALTAADLANIKSAVTAVLNVVDVENQRRITNAAAVTTAIRTELAALASRTETWNASRAAETSLLNQKVETLTNMSMEVSSKLDALTAAIEGLKESIPPALTAEEIAVAVQSVLVRTPITKTEIYNFGGV